MHYCAPLHGGEVVERVSHRREAEESVCSCTQLWIYIHIYDASLLSLKTQLVARQQEHAVTGMLGVFEKASGSLNKPCCFCR